MLVKRDSIAKKRFIAACLILLINFLVFEHFDLGLHGGDLLVQIQNDILMDHISLPIFLLPACECSDFVRSLLQVRVTLEFLVDDRSRGSLVNIVMTRGKLNVASLCCSTSWSSTYSAYTIK